MNEQQRLDYLDLMDVQVWLPRKSEDKPDINPSVVVKEKVTDSEVDSIESVPAPVTTVSLPTWNDLCEQVKNCTKCSLHQTRTQTVFGVGDERADWMIIGEAPGAEEDRQGEPFVGRAGMLLNEIFFSLGLRRDRVFIANILKCRPPNNRDPLPEEVEACSAYLEQQVRQIAPRIILALGRIAAQNLLQTTESIGRLRGQVHYYQTIPVIVIYHPAYLLRSPTEKRKVLQDLILARRTLKKLLIQEIRI